MGSSGGGDSGKLGRDSLELWTSAALDSPSTSTTLVAPPPEGPSLLLPKSGKGSDKIWSRLRRFSSQSVCVAALLALVVGLGGDAAVVRAEMVSGVACAMESFGVGIGLLSGGRVRGTGGGEGGGEELELFASMSDTVC